MKKLTLILMLASISVTSGCAVFRGDQLPQLSMPLQATAPVLPSVSYSLKAKKDLGGIKDFDEKPRQILEAELLSSLEQSKQFGRISKNDPEADIKIDVMFTSKANPAAVVPAFLTGLTLYAIPSWAKEELLVKAKITSNGQTKEYRFNDHVTLVQWLPMLFVFPVKNFSQITETRENIYFNIIGNMKKDGLL